MESYFHCLLDCVVIFQQLTFVFSEVLGIRNQGLSLVPDLPQLIVFKATQTEVPHRTGLGTNSLIDYYTIFKTASAMYLLHIRTLVQLICLLSVIYGDLEVINDEAPREEFNLQDEGFLPAEPIAAKLNKMNQRRLASVDQDDDITRNSLKDLKNEAVIPHPVVETSQENIHIEEHRHLTPEDSIDTFGVEWQTLNGAKPVQNDDNFEIVNEGFLLVNSKDKVRSRNGRKLTQFMELFSQDNSQSSAPSNVVDVSPVSSEKSQREASSITLTTSTNEIPHEELLQLPGFTKDTTQQQQIHLHTRLGSLQSSNAKTTVHANKISSNSENSVDQEHEFGSSLKLACVNEQSWECLMFKEDYAAMMNDLNMSSRSSALERSKRQAATNTGSKGSTSRNIAQIIGCENNDCFSGNGTDEDEDYVVPVFEIPSVTKTPTNLTNYDLDDKKKQEIAKQLEDQLNEIFKDIPGFKNITIDPKEIEVLDGNLVIPWTIPIDGGNPIFSDKNGKEVRDIIEDALNKASDSYNKNVTVDGKHPIDAFNSTKAAEQVEEQAKDPCKMTPNPCPLGYGSCTRLPSQGNGIPLQCINNCKTFGQCENMGTCQKDITGTAYCQCQQNWLGLYCEKANGTTSRPDKQTSPEFKFNSTSSFNTTLTPKDLTPEMLDEITKNFTKQMTDLLKDLPGLNNVTVTSIEIVNGTLVIHWEVGLDPTAYSNKNPTQIADTVRDSLQNVSDVYRHSIVIGDQNPLHDFDYVNAADQIKDIASDPCKTHPCPFGFGSCRALSPINVKCYDNCNAIPDCLNDGTCVLKSGGEATCECTRDYSGKSCSEEIQTLDGGKTTGIVIGSLLIAAGVIGSCCWLLLLRRGQKPVNYTNYTDEEGSSSSSSLYKPCVIDRPFVSTTPLPLFRQSSYITPISSFGSGLGSNSSNLS